MAAGVVHWIMLALRSRIDGLKDLAKETGRVNAAWYLLARALEVMSGGRVRLIKYYLMAQPVAPAPLSGKPVASMSVAIVGPEAPCAGAFPRPAEVIRQRFDSGALCFAATSGDSFVGFLWLKERQYEEDEVHCLFVPGPAGQAVWDFDVYVEPRYRIGRAFSRLWDAAYAFMRANGYRWTMSRVSAFNSASLRSHARLGAVPVGSATFVCAGALQISLLSRAPYIHVRFGGRGRPTVHVDAPH